MTAISVAKQQADRANPKKILGDFLRQTDFMGEPIFTLLVDEIESGKIYDAIYIRDFVHHKIDSRADFNKTQKKGLRDFFDGHHWRRYAVISLMCEGLESAARAYAKNDYTNDPCPVGVVFVNAGRLHPEQLLTSLCVSRAYTPPLLKDYSAWHFLVHAHERAHTIGADEPQADKIAAILCRKHFNDTAAVAIMSDLRMMDCARSSIMAYYARKDVCGGAMDNLHLYGYPTVEAYDSVLSMPQDDVDSMTDYQITKIRHERFDPQIPTVKDFGWVATTDTAERSILSPHIFDIAVGAEQLAKKIDRRTDDPKVHAMAHRFALATKRLAEGASAYVDVQNTVQKLGSLPPT